MTGTAAACGEEVADGGTCLFRVVGAERGDVDFGEDESGGGDG